MRFVPRAERTAWRAKAMDAVGRAHLGSLIDLWLETRHVDRLAARLRTATDAEIEGSEPLRSSRVRPAADALDVVFGASEEPLAGAREVPYPSGAPGSP